MKAKYLVTENRFLLKLFAAKSPWTVLFFVIPIESILTYLMTKSDVTTMEVIVSFPLAFLYWSLVEYIIHRWYFHWVPRNELLRFITGSFHLYHHERPDDLEVINSGWVTGIIGALFHFCVFKYFFQASLSMALPLTFSLVIVYYIYEWVHYLVHQRIFEHGLMNYLQNFHLTHHVSPKKNYGQITPLWDYIFGTVRDNMETKDHDRMRAYVKGALS